MNIAFFVPVQDFQWKTEKILHCLDSGKKRRENMKELHHEEAVKLNGFCELSVVSMN